MCGLVTRLVLRQVIILDTGDGHFGDGAFPITYERNGGPSPADDNRFGLWLVSEGRSPKAPNRLGIEDCPAEVARYRAHPGLDYLSTRALCRRHRV